MSKTGSEADDVHNDQPVETGDGDTSDQGAGVEPDSGIVPSFTHEPEGDPHAADDEDPDDEVATRTPETETAQEVGSTVVSHSAEVKTGDKDGTDGDDAEESAAEAEPAHEAAHDAPAPAEEPAKLVEDESVTIDHSPAAATAESDDHETEDGTAEEAIRVAPTSGATDTEPEATGDRNVDEVDRELAEHDQGLDFEHRGEPPEADLDETEDLIEAMGPDAPLLTQQRQLSEDDTGWETGRDAAGSADTDTSEAAEPGSVNEDASEDDAVEAGGPGEEHSGNADPEDLLDSDNNIDGEEGEKSGSWFDILNTAIEKGPEADRPVTRSDVPAVVLDPEYAAGIYIELRRSEPAEESDEDGPIDYSTDTPQPGEKLPEELVRATDYLSGLGPAGEQAALVLVEEYLATGNMPFSLPAEETDESASEEPPVDPGYGQQELFGA